MNLQSPHQLPATTPATTSTNTSPAAGQAVGVRPVAGASLGVDFAQIMARQFQNLPSLLKQQLADSSQLTQAAQELNSANDNAADRNLQDAQQARSPNPLPIEDTQTQVSPRDASGANQSLTIAPPAANPLTPAPKAKAGVDPKDSKLSNPATTLTPIGLALNLPPAASLIQPSQPATATALTAVAAAQSAPSDGADVTLVSSSSGQAPVMAHAMLSNPWLKNMALISSTSHSNGSASELKTVALSPKLSIVTPANNATSPESLTAFAQSMGLDDSAIAKLLNPSPSSASVAAGIDTSSAATLSQASATPQSALSSPVTQQTANQSSAASQLAAMGVTSFEVTQSAAANPASTQAQTVTSLQNSATAFANPIDNTSNLAFTQQVVSASAGIVGSSSATTLKTSATLTSDSSLSTVDALHLIDMGVSANDVAALSSGMAAGDFSGNNTGQQGASNGGFGQGLATLAAPTTSNTNQATDPTTQAAQAPSEAKMQEVYDQLSDKLATEMATRMHKQLNDGQWKMKFGLRPANLGGVEIQLEMKDGKLNASFNVDNPLTGHLLQNAAARLRETLGNFGIQAGQVQIGQNASGQSQGGQQGNSQQSSSQPQVMENSSRLNNTANESQSDNPVKSPSESSTTLDLFA